jgi:nodulation protein E
MRRVVVTGVGVLSSIGNSAAQFGESLRAGRPGIGPIAQVDTSRLRFRNAAEIQGFEPNKYFSESQLTWLDRFAQLGIVAARDAIADSGLAWNDALRARTGVIAGSCLGGIGTEDAYYFDF